MCSAECRNDIGDNHYIKHVKMDWRVQTSVGKQHSLCSLQTSVQSPAAQRRMSKQWSMPSSSSANCAESAGGVGGGCHTKDSRTTALSKSSSCRSAAGSTTRRAANILTTEITIDIADVDDDVTTTSQSAAATRRSVARNSSLNSDRQLLDVYYDSEHR